MGNLLLIYLSTLSLGTAKFIFDFSGVYLLLPHSLLTTCAQFFSHAKNFNPDDLHSLYTIDQNNLVTLLYLIATAFLQLWNFALSNISIQTMLSIAISPVDKCLINFMKSFNLLHFSNLFIIFNNNSSYRNSFRHLSRNDSSFPSVFSDSSKLMD